jgi:hypothetical protein
MISMCTQGKGFTRRTRRKQRGAEGAPKLLRALIRSPRPPREAVPSFRICTKNWGRWYNTTPGRRSAPVKPAVHLDCGVGEGSPDRASGDPNGWLPCAAAAFCRSACSSKKRGCASCRTSIPRPFPTSPRHSCRVDWRATPSAPVNQASHRESRGTGTRNLRVLRALRVRHLLLRICPAARLRDGDGAVTTIPRPRARRSLGIV